MTRVVTVGIAGGSGAGKTTLARLLAERFGRVSLLDMDSYYLDRGGVPSNARARINFDEPDAFDIKLLMLHLRDLREGRDIEKPRYSFVDHTRIGSEPISPAPLLLVEGLFALWWEDLRELFDLKVYLDAPPDLRKQRRISRDVESRGRTVASVLHQYEMTVLPMHERYVEPTRSYADLVLETDRDVWTCLGSICSALHGTRSWR